MIRLSVSLLESYRLYRSGEWMTTEALEASIRGEFETTPAMLLGRAFHGALEHHKDRWDGYEFRGMEPEIYLPAGVSEAKETRVIETDSGLVRLVGKADYLLGTVAYEVKTKEKALDPEHYMASLQWRAYCVLFGCRKVVYRLVQLKASKGGGWWDVVEWDDLPLYAYPALEDELRAEVSRFAAFLTERGLAPHLLEAA